MSEFVPLHGFGGSGGAPLNFDVVGGLTQPAGLKENTIWVPTDRKPTGWHFSAERPANLKPDELWFQVGVSSTVAFSALKKKTVMIYPLHAKQLVDGVLIDREAKTWQNGKWNAWWNGELYSPGNEWPDITGGWEIEGDGDVQKTADCLQITPKPGSASTIMVKTKNRIDLSDCNTLRFEMDGSGNYTDVHVGVISEYGEFIAVRDLGGMDSDIVISRDYHNVDVSSLNESYRVAVSVYNGASEAPLTLNVYNVDMK